MARLRRQLAVLSSSAIVAVAFAAIPNLWGPSLWETSAWAAGEFPLPRFVSVRSGEVNLRTGPGVRYPIDWVFIRRDLPVEIVAEYETWRQIRDHQGTTGWVHKSMLSGKRTVLMQEKLVTLRRDANTGAPPVARAQAGVIGELVECDDVWCRVEVAGIRGWAERAKLWGVYPGED
ncbi:MAG: SH3 domain-containing protein [Alphaproteobacteria bacterium]